MGTRGLSESPLSRHSRHHSTALSHHVHNDDTLAESSNGFLAVLIVVTDVEDPGSLDFGSSKLNRRLEIHFRILGT